MEPGIGKEKLVVIISRRAKRMGSAKRFLLRKMLTLCGHVLVIRNTLKLTYGNVEIHNFPGGRPLAPTSRGEV